MLDWSAKYDTAGTKKGRRPFGWAVAACWVSSSAVLSFLLSKINKKIEKNLGIKTILTREEDTFIKLQDRTKFANKNEGSLFVSIHVNSAKSRKAYGFETYFLSTSKNESAIRVAARENSVLELEGSVQTLKNEDLIRATIAQASFLQHSEWLAAIIQKEIDNSRTTLCN